MCGALADGKGAWGHTPKAASTKTETEARGFWPLKPFWGVQGGSPPVNALQEDEAATARAGDFEPTPAPLRGLKDEEHELTVIKEDEAATARAGDFEPTPAPLRGLKEEKHELTDVQNDDGCFSIVAGGHDVTIVMILFVLVLSYSVKFFDRKDSKNIGFGTNLK